MKSVYVAHTISTRHRIRDKFCPEIQALGIRTINPFYEEDGSWREDRPEIKAIDQGKLREYCVGGLMSSEDIVRRDLARIRCSDGIVAIMKEPSIGCSMEIFYCARICKKPVFIVTSKRYSTHPWLDYFASITGGKITTNEKELIETLKKWKNVC